MQNIGVYKIFAENLRRLCDQHLSIADVCRQMTINRQQFNKYLAGTNLPSQKIIARFSEFFNVSESSFFQSSDEINLIPSADPNDETANFLNVQTSGMLKPASSQSGLSDGIYRAFSAWLPNPEYFFVFTIEIFTKQGRAHYHWNYSFKGNPFYKERPISRWARGLVFNDHGKINLIGKMTNPSLPGFMSLLLDHGNKWPNGVWSGVLTGFMPNNLPFAGTVVLQRLSQGTSRMAVLRTNGVYGPENDVVPLQIQQLLQRQPRLNANHMTAVDMMKNWHTVAIAQ